MHASLAVTPDGLPLGLTAAKFWSRDRFKGTTALEREINPTRVPNGQKESVRWLENLRRSTELTGTTVLWRGFTRLADLEEGFRAARTEQKLLVGN